jgi:hypothetical protein
MFSLYQKILFQAFLSFLMIFFIFFSIFAWFKLLEGQSIFSLDLRFIQLLLPLSAFLSTLWHLSRLTHQDIFHTCALYGYPPFKLVKVLLSFTLLITILSDIPSIEWSNHPSKYCLALIDKQQLCWENQEAYLLSKPLLKYPLLPPPKQTQDKNQPLLLVISLLLCTSMILGFYHIKAKDKYSLAIVFSLIYFLIQRILSLI